MTYETRLRRIAEKFARERETETEPMKRRKLEILNEVANLQVEIDHRAAAMERFQSYINVLDREYICPICWVSEGIDTRIAPAGDYRRSFYRCRRCGWEDEHKL